MKILGCETSCDDTSIAVLDNTRILSNIVYSQDHNKFGGVFPEQASREHLLRIEEVYLKAMEESGISLEEIDLVAATYAPGLVGSLLVGYSFARALSYGAGKRFFPVHHIKGHVYAAMLENQVELPAIALVVSGGHTSLLLLDGDHNFREIGSTLDDAAGEVYDKVGRMIGLPFPAGRMIDELSQRGEANIEMPFFRDSSYDFSFSGLKSFVFRFLQVNRPRNEDLAASFQLAIERTIVPKSVRAFREHRVKSFILAGGVASNSGLRRALKRELGSAVVWPSSRLCLDNGAMIAAAAHFMMENGKEEIADGVRPTVRL